MKTTRDFQARIFNRINPAVRFSVTRYVFAIGVFVAIFAFGLISILNIGVDLFPSINFPYVVAQGKALIRQITILAESGNSAAVTGVDAGNTVVVNPPPGLLEGSAVKTLPVSESGAGN